MGELDIEKLFEIKYETRTISEKNNLPYIFKVDLGSFETAIEFVGINHFHPPISQSWIDKPDIFCPDLLDYENRIIIEYEEETGEKKSGAHLAKKGHGHMGDIDTKRDNRRNRFYKQGGFRIIRIWESDHAWKKHLKDFLLNITLINNTE